MNIRRISIYAPIFLGATMLIGNILVILLTVFAGHGEIEYKKGDENAATAAVLGAVSLISLGLILRDTKEAATTHKILLTLVIMYFAAAIVPNLWFFITQQSGFTLQILYIILGGLALYDLRSHQLVQK